MYTEFINKVVVVTGAGAGIGREIALRFGDEGAIVIVNDLRPERAKLVAKEIGAMNGQAISIAGDMTRVEDVDRVFDQVMETFSQLYVLVNNVGLYEYGMLVGSSEEEWDRDMAINIKSTYLCSNRAAKEMKKAGTGQIVNISSGAGKIGGTNSRGYSAAKWAVIGLTKSLAAELAPDIRVNSVCPGMVSTDMDEAFLQKFCSANNTTSEEYKRTRLAYVPLNRVGTPNDVANSVIFLASNQAAYTTGEALNVSGGLIMH